MKNWSQPFFGSIAVLALGSGAFAQMQSVAQFAGGESETFEGTQVIFTPCMPSRVFNSHGDLCTPGNSACHTTTSFSYFCTIYPNAGQYLFSTVGGSAEFTFDQPIARFGGWFGSNNGQPDATFDFYDASNAQIASVVGAVPADCSWHWLGWQAPAQQPIKRIVVTSNHSSGGFLDMDDLQIDFAILGPTMYCTGKVNSLGCTPTIAFAGAPDHTGATSFDITASNVLGQKPGHLFYSVSGAATQPFKGGTLCVAQPIRRTALQNSGGVLNTCSGTLQFNFNAYCLSGANPALTAGTTVWAQYWSFDPGFSPPNRASYSNAVRFTM